MNLTIDTPENIMLDVSPFAKEDTIPSETTRTTDSRDLMAYYTKKYPGRTEQQSKGAPRKVRFFEEVKNRAKKINNVLKNNGKPEDTSIGPGSNSTMGATEESSSPYRNEDTPDFFDDDAFSYDEEASLAISALDDNFSTCESKDERKQYHRQSSSTHSSSTAGRDTNNNDVKRSSKKLEVGFVNRNRPRIGQLPIGRAFNNIKNKVLRQKPARSVNHFRKLSMDLMRNLSSNKLNKEPPTWKEYHDLEKEMMETKLELAMVQTELDHNKSRLRRTVAERDWLHQQYTTLQHEYQGAQDTIHEYQTMVQHLKQHAQEASMERSTMIDMERSCNESFSLAAGGIGVGNKGNRSWPNMRTSKIFNPKAWEGGNESVHF